MKKNVAVFIVFLSILAGMGFFLLIIYFSLRRHAKARRQKYAALQNLYTYVDGTIVKVYSSRDVFPREYTILCEYQLPHDREMKMIGSDPLSFHPRPLLKKRDIRTLRIFYDQDNPELIYADTSGLEALYEEAERLAASRKIDSQTEAELMHDEAVLTEYALKNLSNKGIPSWLALLSGIALFLLLASVIVLSIISAPIVGIAAYVLLLLVGAFLLLPKGMKSKIAAAGLFLASIFLFLFFVTEKDVTLSALLAFPFLGIIFLGAGVMLYKNENKPNIARFLGQLLKLTGRKVTARIASIQKNPLSTYNGVHPWQITLRYTHPTTLETVSIFSENLFFDPTDAIRKAGLQELPLYLCRWNAYKYIISLEQIKGKPSLKTEE